MNTIFPCSHATLWHAGQYWFMAALEPLVVRYVTYLKCHKIVEPSMCSRTWQGEELWNKTSYIHSDPPAVNYSKFVRLTKRLAG